MWNATNNALGGAYDKEPGDRYVAKKDKDFKPYVIEVRVFCGEVKINVVADRLVSGQDLAIGLTAEKLIREIFENNPVETKIKKLNDGKTIDI